MKGNLMLCKIQFQIYYSVDGQKKLSRTTTVSNMMCHKANELD